MFTGVGRGFDPLVYMALSFENIRNSQEGNNRFMWFLSFVSNKNGTG